MGMRLLAATLLYLVSFALSAAAQEPRPSVQSREQPLEITADTSLEWRRGEKQYVARGNAQAQQGDVSISAQTLTADYVEEAGSGMDISRLTAEAGVAIVSQGHYAAGDRAVYDVIKGIAIMTGQNLTLTAPDLKVTAKDSFEYRVAEGRLTAIGNARAVRTTDNIAADRLSAVFVTDPATGKRALKRLEATGGVTIKTATETLTGDTGQYDAATSLAIITGNVRITRGPNMLEGDKAEVNLATGISRMLGGATGTGGRVRGIFYPGTVKKEDVPGSIAPSATAPFAPEPVVSENPVPLLTGQ